MRMTVTILAISFFLNFPMFAHANISEPSSQSEAWQETFLRDLSSPYTTPARSALLTGTSLTVALLILEDQVSDPLSVHLDEKKPLGTISHSGDRLGYFINGVYIAAFWADSLISGSKKSKSRATLMLKSTLYSAGVTNILKYITREPRPDMPSDRTAFPSGHATSAFAFASVVGMEHAWLYGLTAYSLAAFISFSRMNDNKHELHQVVAGATIGLSYGLGLYYRSQARKETIPQSGESSSTVFQVLPANNLDGGTLLISSEF